MSLIEKESHTSVASSHWVAGKFEPLIGSFIADGVNSIAASWRAWPERLPLQAASSTSRARFPIYRAKDVLPGIPVLCEGWAARVCRFPDGRRQILSFVLPGDLMSVNAVFSDRLGFYIEAITDVRHASYDRRYFDESLRRDRKLVRAVAETFLSEKEGIERQAANLGRRRAEERIARLFLYLMDQMDLRGMVSDQSFPFPLRQQHVADATGLTVVHANRVIGALRNEGAIEITNGIFRVLDLARLQRAAD